MKTKTNKIIKLRGINGSGVVRPVLTVLSRFFQSPADLWRHGIESASVEKYRSAVRCSIVIHKYRYLGAICFVSYDPSNRASEMHICPLHISLL
jgi:hypothetical protein